MNWHGSSREALRDSQGRTVGLLRLIGRIREITGKPTRLSTAGGTSDGRFIAPTGSQVLELGPLNATIHQVNEHVGAGNIETLSEIYERILERLLT